MLINVIGLGYIGLPTALIMSSYGLEITGTDIDQNKIEMLNHNQVTFEEPGIQELYAQAIENGIIFSNEYVQADIYIIAVPTPFDKTSKKIVADYLIEAVRQVVCACKKESIIVVESTISPGTIDNYVRPIIQEKNLRDHYSIELAHAPERILPGKMIEELINNNRVIGADRQEVAQKIQKIYASFCKGEIILTDIRTAEMSKVVENAYRDINIAFANELVKICRAAKIDVYEMIHIANKHPRVNILTPGPGVGGHCISVDPWFLVGDSPGLANIILAARKINDSMPEYVLKRIHEIMIENDIRDVRKVGLYGLTYKENVDDIRESPTLQLLECMQKHLATGIKVYDPYVKNDITDNQYHNFEQFLAEIDCLVLMVGHNHIIQNSDKIKDKIVFDTRNVLNQDNIYRL